MSDPIAYFITWTCYGTWLHGDGRGSVDDQHRTYGQPFIPLDLSKAAEEQSRMKHATVRLDRRARDRVKAAIERHCRLRNWELLAVNVRSNHVHVVAACGPVPPERVLTELKAWSTRYLREAGCVSATARVWTQHGSTRYIWNNKQLSDTLWYVTGGQGSDLSWRP